MTWAETARRQLDQAREAQRRAEQERRADRDRREREEWEAFLSDVVAPIMDQRFNFEGWELVHHEHRGWPTGSVAWFRPAGDESVVFAAIRHGDGAMIRLGYQDANGDWQHLRSPEIEGWNSLGLALEDLDSLRNPGEVAVDE